MTGEGDLTEVKKDTTAEILGKSKELRMRILRVFVQKDDWIALTELLKELGMKYYGQLQNYHLERLRSINILKEDYRTFKKGEKPLKAYIICEGLETYKKIANVFLDSKEDDDPIIFIESKYHRRMALDVANAYLEKIGLKPIPPDSLYPISDKRFPHKIEDIGSQSVLPPLVISPSFLDKIINKNITRDDLRLIIMRFIPFRLLDSFIKAISPFLQDVEMRWRDVAAIQRALLGSVASQQSLDQPVSDNEVSLGLSILGELCTSLDFIQYPLLREHYFRSLKKVEEKFSISSDLLRDVIEGMGKRRTDGFIALLDDFTIDALINDIKDRKDLDEVLISFLSGLRKEKELRSHS
jgi:hypothetical protein